MLQCLVFCGRCGCRMRPHYTTSSPAYICISRRKPYGDPIWQSLTIAHIDRAVSKAFVKCFQTGVVGCGCRCNLDASCKISVGPVVELEEESPQ